MFEKIPHQRTAEAAALQIEALILNGVLRPGDRLPSERDLAERMDVSRPVLREALKSLESGELIVSRQGGGTFVADVIGPVFSPPIIALMERHPEAVNDFLEFRRDIEGVAAFHAATRATASDHAVLSSIVDQMKTAFEANDDQREASLDVEFHHAVGEAAHNMILLHALRSCYRLLENGILYSRKRLYHHPTARERVLNQHTEIANSILQGNPQAAKLASEAHIDFVSEAIKEAEKQDTRNAVSELRLRHRPV